MKSFDKVVKVLILCFLIKLSRMILMFYSVDNIILISVICFLLKVVNNMIGISVFIIKFLLNIVFNNDCFLFILFEEDFFINKIFFL